MGIYYRRAQKLVYCVLNLLRKIKVKFQFCYAGDHHHDNQSNPKMRVGSYGRIHTPRSPASYAYDGADNSDDDGTETVVGEDTEYFDEGINSSANVISQVFNLFNKIYSYFTIHSFHIFYFILFQDIYSNIQSMSLVPTQPEHANNDLSNLHRKVAKEVNSTVDHGNEKVELFSENNIPVNDGNNILPEATMMKGN